MAAVIKNDKLEVLTSVGNECEYVMCFEVLTGNSEFIIINAYCQHSLPLEGFLDKIENIINSFQTEKVLIVMDSNSKSELWFDKVTNPKGVVLEEFMYEHNLTILNKP